MHGSVRHCRSLPTRSRSPSRLYQRKSKKRSITFVIVSHSEASFPSPNRTTAAPGRALLGSIGPLWPYTQCLPRSPTSGMPWHWQAWQAWILNSSAPTPGTNNINQIKRPSVARSFSSWTFSRLDQEIKKNPPQPGRRSQNGHWLDPHQDISAAP